SVPSRWSRHLARSSASNRGVASATDNPVARHDGRARVRSFSTGIVARRSSPSYTPGQKRREAMGRLLPRLTQSGEETEAFAGLVQVLRYCGLLDESVAAHHRAKALDPTITTSVCHSHFLR